MTDAVEEWPEGDHTWVAALGDLTAGTTGRQHDELRHLAAVLHQDARLLGVDELEARRLGTLADGADPAVQPSDEVAESDRAAYVLDLAHLVLVTRLRLAAAWE